MKLAALAFALGTLLAAPGVANGDPTVLAPMASAAVATATSIAEKVDSMFSEYHGDEGTYEVNDNGHSVGDPIPDLTGVAALAPVGTEEVEMARAARLVKKEDAHAVAVGAIKHHSAIRESAEGHHAVPKAGCFGKEPWTGHSAVRSSYALYMAFEAYRIGSDKPLRVGDTLHGISTEEPAKVLLVDRHGRKSEHLGNYQGPFFVAKQGGVMWVAFRGSDSGMDWLTDLTASWTTVSFARASGSPRVVGDFHRGFADLWHKLALTPRFDALRAAHPGLEWRFTGHSLGGALAQLGALEYSVKHGGRPETYTFGSPRVGGADTRAWLHMYEKHFRFKHAADVVPSVPTLGLKCMASAALGGFLAEKLDPDCKLHYYHSAAVSVHLTDDEGPVCIPEDNLHAGYNPLDHLSAKYVKTLFPMAVDATRKAGKPLFNGGKLVLPE